MNPVKQAIKDLERKYKERIERGNMLSNSNEWNDITEEEAERMILVQIEDIKTWPVSKIISELIDPEDLLIREALNRFS